MDITTKQIIEAINLGYPVTVIINGEYYNYIPKKESADKKEATK